MNMNGIRSDDLSGQANFLSMLLETGRIKNPELQEQARRTLATIKAGQEHHCPGIASWPYDRQRQFVLEHRQEPEVLWQLRKAMMTSQGKVPDSLQRICCYRISDDHASKMVQLCADKMFPLDTKSPETRLFGQEFAWSVPTPEVTAYIHDLTRQGARPVVEIGAGLGYLAREMRAKNVTWHAYDIVADQLPKERLWTQVLPGGPEKLKEHTDPNTILCLCFPPQIGMLGYKMDEQSAMFFRGKDIIYIGEELSEKEEEMNGTGSRDFAVILNKLKYKLVKVLPCAQAPHHFDKLFHYQRV